MKKHLLKLSFLIVTASMFCACDSFLDKQPSATSDAPITEVSQLLSLYDYVTNTYEYDYPGVYATDDYGVPLALYDASPITFGADQMSLYALSSEVMETTTGNNVWEYEYAKIFNANTIIASVGSVNGSQEEKDEALCNAYLMRGWSFFRLATVHCLPYSEANRSEMGLPLRLGTLFTEDISRATLGKTFDRILDDFREAEKYCVVDRVQEGFAWRASKCAIYGAFARVYLYMNDYDNATTYVDKALALAPGLYDYNNLDWATPVPYPARWRRIHCTIVKPTTGICKKSINGQNGFISVCNIWRRNGIPRHRNCWIAMLTGRTTAVSTFSMWNMVIAVFQ